MKNNYALRKALSLFFSVAAVSAFVLLMSGSSMWEYVGCGGSGTVVSTQTGGDPVEGGTTALSNTVSSGSDLTSSSDEGDPFTDENGIHHDHEDVFEADYVSDYYIVVYNLNNSVLVLQKDEYGKYTKQAKTFLCSSGTAENPTLPGVYPIWRKYEWREMMQVYGHYCSGFGYGTGYLFHSVPYNRPENNSQGGKNYDKLGTNASHGCVRLCTRDAKWIYETVPVNTLVHVVDGKNGPAGEPVPMRSDESLYRGWDPTDIDPKNPYVKKPPEDVTYFTHTSAPVTTTTVAQQ